MFNVINCVFTKAAQYIRKKIILQICNMAFAIAESRK